MEILPPNLRLDLSLIIHSSIVSNIRFFKKRKDDLNFICWVCPMLKPMLVAHNEFIF